MNVTKITSNIDNQTQLIAVKNDESYLISLNNSNIISQKKLNVAGIDLKYYDYYQNTTLVPLVLARNKMVLNDVEIEIEDSDGFYVTDIHFSRNPSIFLKKNKTYKEYSFN